MSASFVYDGDGARVKSTVNGTVTHFVGGHYEAQGMTVSKYYFAGAQRIAVRKSGTLSYLLSDHLGSVSATTNTAGQLVSGQLYKAWGESRYSLGTSATKYTYTGQYSYTADFGLMFYNARWYDSSIGRFAQADTVVPQGVQGLDRYAYVNNSPLNYTDPSGHIGCDEDLEGRCISYPYKDKEDKPKGLILIYCGATGPDINSDGEDCGIEGNKGDLTGWGAELQEQYPGYAIEYVTYPGSKADQAKDALDLINSYGNIPTVHLGFSAGGDTAVDVVEDLVAQEKEIDALILLDPPFVSKSLDKPNNSDFDIVVQSIATGTGGQPAVPVFVADGTQDGVLSVSQTDIANYYEYQQYPNMEHYSVLSSSVVFTDASTFFGWR